MVVLGYATMAGKNLFILVRFSKLNSVLLSLFFDFHSKIKD